MYCPHGWARLALRINGARDTAPKMRGPGKWEIDGAYGIGAVDLDWPTNGVERHYHGPDCPALGISDPIPGSQTLPGEVREDKVPKGSGGSMVCKSRPGRGTRLSPACLASICQIEKTCQSVARVRIGGFLGTCGLTTSTAPAPTRLRLNSAWCETHGCRPAGDHGGVESPRRAKSESLFLLPESIFFLPRCGPGLVWSGLRWPPAITRWAWAVGGVKRWACSL